MRFQVVRVPDQMRQGIGEGQNERGLMRYAGAAGGRALKVIWTREDFGAVAVRYLNLKSPFRLQCFLPQYCSVECFEAVYQPS